MAYLFSSESVFEGHPDKVADQINGALLDQFLAYDGDARCTIETFNTTDQVVIMGEIRSKECVDLQTIACRTTNRIGYTKAGYQFNGNSCDVLSAIYEQSDDISRGVDNGNTENQGTDNQGMMLGYACGEADDCMSVTLDLTHLLMTTLADTHKEDKQMTYFRPDSKSQAIIEYSDGNIPQRIDTIVVSTQHDNLIRPADNSRKTQLKADKEMVEQIHKDVSKILMPHVKAQITSEGVLALLNGSIEYLVNPAGKFVIGGPRGDTGLTGRKIIVDTYGDKGGHGGGTFSGKDSSKVDHSAAYTTRYIAKSMVATGLSDEILIQLTYAIGVAEPVSIYADTYGRSHVKVADGEITKVVRRLFDLHPKTIEKILKLHQPMYLETAAYGRTGRQNEVVKKTFESHYHEKKTADVELFTWEKLDRVEDIKKTFGL